MVLASIEVSGKMPKEFKPGEVVCVSHMWGGKTLATVIRMQEEEVYWLKDNSTGKEFYCGAKWIESIEETKP